MWWCHFTVCCGAIKHACRVIGAFAPLYHFEKGGRKHGNLYFELLKVTDCV